MECWTVTGRPHQLKNALYKVWLKHGGTTLQFLCGQQHGVHADGALRYYKAYVQFKHWVTKARVIEIFNLDEWAVDEAYGESEDFIGATREGDHMLDVPHIRYGCDNQSLRFLAMGEDEAEAASALDSIAEDEDTEPHDWDAEP